MLLILCIAVLAVADTTSAVCKNDKGKRARGPICGKNQHYDQCATQCPLTCDNYKDSTHVCTTVCQPGCTCNDGFVQNRKGQCVSKDQCFDNPPVCPKYSSYNSCGTACPETCDNMNDPPGACSAVCNPSCQCDDGYVKDQNRQCVKPEDCPIAKQSSQDNSQSQCPVNEAPSNCVIPCNDCTRRGICNYQCNRSGCDCIRGYYRNANGTCIPERNCPPCPVNEGRSNCVSTCNTCKDRGNCNYPCNGGCDCFQGYYRNANGTCIRAQDCPSQCPVNEAPSNCVIPCNDCTRRGICNYQCTRSGCDCIQGYYRNANGTCIPERNCPPCPVNEGRSNCVSTCNTCRDRGNCSYPCNGGCDCYQGYYRNANGTCIAARDCPRFSRRRS